MNNKKELNGAFIRVIALLLEEPPNQVKKHPLQMQLRLLEKIKNTTELFSNALMEGKDDRTVENELLHWKQKLTLLGMDAQSDLAVTDQVQQLFHATQKHDLKGMGEAFKLLAQYTESAGAVNIQESLAALQSRLSASQLEAVTTMVHSHPQNITRALYEVSEKLLQRTQEVDLDEIVRTLEANAGSLAGPGKEKEAAYSKAAKNSISKSLVAHGIKPIE